MLDSFYLVFIVKVVLRIMNSNIFISAIATRWYVNYAQNRWQIFRKKLNRLAWLLYVKILLVFLDSYL